MPRCPPIIDEIVECLQDLGKTRVRPFDAPSLGTISITSRDNFAPKPDVIDALPRPVASTLPCSPSRRLENNRVSLRTEFVQYTVQYRRAGLFFTFQVY